MKNKFPYSLADYIPVCWLKIRKYHQKPEAILFLFDTVFSEENYKIINHL